MRRQEEKNRRRNNGKGEKGTGREREKRWRLETTRWPCDVEKGGGVRACVRA